MTTTKEEFQSLLDDPEVKARVLAFPEGHCGSSAIGLLQRPDGRCIFVKDRDDPVAIVQETVSLVGKEFCKTFAGVDNVTPICHSIERPNLDELKEDGPGYLLWKLKEEKWKREHARSDTIRPRKNSEEKKTVLDDEASFEDEIKESPSTYDRWQLEEAVTYCMSRADELDMNDTSVDQSLRRKLRLAAERSGRNCLEFSKVLVITKFIQDLVRGGRWQAYKSELLEDPVDALNEAETLLLLREKISGVEFEASMMFVAAMALPDVNFENLALQEIDEGSSFRVRLLHIDTGVLPASAGVSIETLEPVLEEGVCDFGFCGEAECTDYYFPCLFALPAVRKPLSADALAGLQEIDTDAMKNILLEHVSDEEVFEEDLGGLGDIVKQRVHLMKEYATANPSSSLRMILFHTVAAWKRDWLKFYKKSEYAGDVYAILRWAKGK